MLPLPRVAKYGTLDSTLPWHVQIAQQIQDGVALGGKLLQYCGHDIALWALAAVEV